MAALPECLMIDLVICFKIFLKSTFHTSNLRETRISFCYCVLVSGNQGPTSIVVAVMRKKHRFGILENVIQKVLGEILAQSLELMRGGTVVACARL